MKISSKSILNPCRGRNTPICLSTSLSRRLRTNTSLKGGQSPMFPTSGKKRGCALENPGEPSSPKVTCIGQVRVKTKKKQGKRMRGGEVGVGFGRVEQSREGFNNNNHPNQIQNQECLKHRNQRWVHLPLSICEALRGFGSEFSCLFQCGREKEEKTEAGERSLRRHVDLGEKIEIEEEKWEVNDCIVEEEEEEEESRVSICIPPKNALLLMRCRSDPMRMSALTNRLWELQSAPEGEEEDNDDHEQIEMSENLTSITANEEEEEDADEDLVMEVQEGEEKENPEDKLEIIQEEDDNEEEEKQQVSSLSEAFADPEKLENEEEEKEDASNLIQERESHHSSSTEDETEEKETQERLESEERERESHENLESENKEEERERRSVLPDCLLLMMREPKLSMEVSKETWVCSTDFIRWLPERPVNTKDGSDDPKKRISIDSNNPAPPRSSCSFPAQASMSMAAMIEHKLAYEPLVLKRCKSEPRRSAAAKLAPETCFWKNRNLEPHRRATFGVGAAGVGF
ncbi:hypothetical protein CsSME_00018625 [Camellia sinensis var. sinensis]